MWLLLPQFDHQKGNLLLPILLHHPRVLPRGRMPLLFRPSTDLLMVLLEFPTSCHNSPVEVTLLVESFLLQEQVPLPVESLL